MTKTKVQKRGPKDKAGVSHEAVARTLVAVLAAEPEGRTARAIVRAADNLGAAISQPEIYDLRPVFMLQRLFDAHTSCAYDLDGQDKRKGRRAYRELVALAEAGEPRSHKVARRCAEIYDDWLGRKPGRKYADGAFYFVTHVDAVLEGGADGLIPNPDSKYFVPIFAEAWDDRGPRDRRIRELLDLIRRVDEGADLNQLADEAERESDAVDEARRPKDARLVSALSDVLRDPTDEQRERILTAINDLSNETPGVSDLHPDIFPTLARVLIREARTAARGRSRKARNLRRYLGELEAVAGQ